MDAAFACVGHAFYDEVNWNLAQLGFASKLPQDIKEAIFKSMFNSL